MELKIGDTIKIINTGEIYPSYLKKAKELGLNDWIEISHDTCDSLLNKEGIILNIKGDYLGIKLKKFSIIINREGVKKITPKNKYYGLVLFMKKYKLC